MARRWRDADAPLSPGRRRRRSSRSSSGATRRRGGAASSAGCCARTTSVGRTSRGGTSLSCPMSFRRAAYHPTPSAPAPRRSSPSPSPKPLPAKPHAPTPVTTTPATPASAPHHGRSCPRRRCARRWRKRTGGAPRVSSTRTTSGTTRWSGRRRGRCRCSLSSGAACGASAPTRSRMISPAPPTRCHMRGFPWWPALVAQPAVGDRDIARLRHEGTARPLKGSGAGQL